MTFHVIASAQESAVPLGAMRMHPTTRPSPDQGRRKAADWVSGRSAAQTISSPGRGV